MNANFRRIGYAAIFFVAGSLVTLVWPLIAARLAGPGHRTPNCQAAIDNGYCQNANKCDVVVNVTECGPGVKPTAVPDDLSVCEEASITWRLVSPASGPVSGAKFASNGIAFKSDDGGTAEFDRPKVKNYTYEYRDRHTKKDADPPVYYKYGMHILKKDASPCIDFDPRIYNE